MKAKCKKVSDYWHEFYVKDGMCSLCGNSGRLDTTLTAKSQAGYYFGRVNFCICPNGQAMRHHEFLEN